MVKLAKLVLLVLWIRCLNNIFIKRVVLVILL
nr:MAG TPA: hypothetical protein [Caudoviricetes sp.]DAR00630.1 MAG TPA: hypothetical protein [Crassvirales sp.]